MKNLLNIMIIKSKIKGAVFLVMFLFAFPFLTFGQEKIIYGVVEDMTSKEPISSADVFIKNSTIGTTTDINGNFMIAIAKGRRAILVVSHVSYGKKEIEINDNLLSNKLTIYLEPKEMQLSKMVISANQTLVTKRKAPSLVGVVSRRVMEAVEGECVADALDFQSGVRVEDNCASCGQKSARINGLDGHYTQLLIDSRPVLSLVSNFYGLEQIPANMIERTEVMRGGGSALYGASAIGGTINIITREPYRNAFEFSQSVKSIGMTNSFDKATSLNATRVSDNCKNGATIFFQNRQSDGYSYYDDGYTNLPRLRVTAAGTHAFFRTGELSKIDVTYFFMNDDRRGGNKLELPADQSNLTEEMKHTMNNLNLNHHWTSNNDRWHNDAFLSVASVLRNNYAGGTGGLDRIDTNADRYYRLLHAHTFNGGTMMRYHFNKLFFMPSDFTGGLEYTGDFLKDKSLGFIDPKTNDYLTLEQNVHILSAYFQNEWKDENLDILIGVRADKHNLLEHVIVSPRVNVKYSPVENLDLRAGYSKGFRAPQIYDQDLHEAMADGQRFRIVQSDSLKEESSHTVNLSFDYYFTVGKHVKMNFMMEGFYTALCDVFTTRVLEDQFDETGAQIMDKYNASGAHYAGVNLEYKIKYSNKLEGDMGLTLQHSRYNEVQQWSDDVEANDRILRTPESYGYISLNYIPTKHFVFDITGTYTGKMDVAHMAGSGTPKDLQVTTDPFFDLNAKLTYRFTILKETKMEVAVALMNVFNSYQKDFDRGAFRDSDYIYGPSCPRSLSASMSVKF